MKDLYETVADIKNYVKDYTGKLKPDFFVERYTGSTEKIVFAYADLYFTYISPFLDENRNIYSDPDFVEEVYKGYTQDDDLCEEERPPKGPSMVEIPSWYVYSLSSKVANTYFKNVMKQDIDDLFSEEDERRILDLLSLDFVQWAFNKSYKSDIDWGRYKEQGV